jgi:hypothetical protein
VRHATGGSSRLKTRFVLYGRHAPRVVVCFRQRATVRSPRTGHPPPAAEVASPRRVSDGEKGMGSFEEEGELQARARARDAVRSLRVHVPTARAWWLQVGQRADPGVRHLRRVQAPAAILTRATSRPWAAQPRQDPRAVADKPVVINGAENSSLCAVPNPRPNQKFSSCARRSAPFRSTSPPVNSTGQPSQPHRDPARGCRPLVEMRRAARFTGRGWLCVWRGRDRGFVFSLG